MARSRGAGILQLPRGPRKLEKNGPIPERGDAPVETSTREVQSTVDHDVGENETPGRPIFTQGQADTPLSESAPARLRTDHSRQEPSAVVPLAGICAGGAQ